MFGQTQIGTLLHEEHLQTIRSLQRLEEYLASQSAKRPPDLSKPEARKVLGDVLGDVAKEVERHFGFEENELFTILSEQGEVGIVFMLTEEHGVIRPLALELAEEAAAALAGKGFSADEWVDFHERGRELCEREIFHIQKEEMGLLAAISALVDADTDSDLAGRYRLLAAGA